MGKIYTQVARKEYVCTKCGKAIEKKETYKKLVAMYSKPRLACSNCNFKRSETTSSDYLSQVWDLQDEANVTNEEEAHDVKCVLESIKDEQQEKLDNIPEQLKEAEAGSTLQERIDNLETAINDIESVGWSNEVDIDREDFDSDEEYESAVEEQKQELITNACDEVMEILGSID